MKIAYHKRNIINSMIDPELPMRRRPERPASKMLDPNLNNEIRSRLAGLYEQNLCFDRQIFSERPSSSISYNHFILIPNEPRVPVIEPTLTEADEDLTLQDMTLREPQPAVAPIHPTQASSSDSSDVALGSWEQIYASHSSSDQTEPNYSVPVKTSPDSHSDSLQSRATEVSIDKDKHLDHDQMESLTLAEQTFLMLKASRGINARYFTEHFYRIYPRILFSGVPRPQQDGCESPLDKLYASHYVRDVLPGILKQKSDSPITIHIAAHSRDHQLTRLGVENANMSGEAFADLVDQIFEHNVTALTEGTAYQGLTDQQLIEQLKLKRIHFIFHSCRAAAVERAEEKTDAQVKEAVYNDTLIGQFYRQMHALGWNNCSVQGYPHYYSLLGSRVVLQREFADTSTQQAVLEPAKEQIIIHTDNTVILPGSTPSKKTPLSKRGTPSSAGSPAPACSAAAAARSSRRTPMKSTSRCLFPTLPLQIPSDEAFASPASGRSSDPTPPRTAGTGAGRGALHSKALRPTQPQAARSSVLAPCSESSTGNSGGLTQARTPTGLSSSDPSITTSAERENHVPGVSLQ